MILKFFKKSNFKLNNRLFISPLFISLLVLSSCNYLTPLSNFINEIKIKHENNYKGYIYHSYFNKSMYVNNNKNEIYLIKETINLSESKEFTFASYQANLPLKLLDRSTLIYYLKDNKLELTYEINYLINNNQAKFNLLTKNHLLNTILEETYDFEANLNNNRFTLDFFTYFLDFSGVYKIKDFDRYQSINMNLLENNIININYIKDYQERSLSYFLNNKINEVNFISNEFHEEFISFDENLKIIQIDKKISGTYLVRSELNKENYESFNGISLIKLISRDEFRITL